MNESIISRREFLGVLGAGAMRGQAGAAILVDPKSVLQTFDGWGTSLCWWASVAGRFSQKTRDDWARLIFTLDDGGLGLNIVRFNIGGGENPSIRNTMWDRARMEGYWPGLNQDFNWDADRTQRAVLDDAIRFTNGKGLGLRFETFSNSPPWWMTISKSATGNTSPEGKAADNLAPEHYGNFANYLVRVTQFLERKHRIRVETISPFNEPGNRLWKLGGRQEGCDFTHENMAKAVAAFDPYLKGTPYKLAATEDASIDQAVASWDSFDAATKSRIAQINTHSYAGKMRTELFERAQKDGKALWQSEYGNGDVSGASFVATIIKDLKYLRPSAWVNWQAVSPGTWGMILNDHIREDWSRQKKFYAMAQFSRFIRPGARFLAIDDEAAVAAYHPAERHLSVVIQNRDKEKRRVRFDLAHFKHLGRRIQWYETELLQTGGANMASRPAISMDAHSFAAELSPESVSTFVADTR